MATTPRCLPHANGLLALTGGKRRLPATAPATQKSFIEAGKVSDLQREGDGAGGERESPVRLDRGDRQIWTAAGLALRVTETSIWVSEHYELVPG